MGTGPIVYAAETVQLNNSVGKNEIFFNSKAPGEEINGTAGNIIGSFQIDLAKLEATTGKITVAVNSMETGISKRDQHMRSDEWLDAEKFPYIDFNIKYLTNVQWVSNDPSSGKAVINAEAVGDFYIHGVMKEIKAKITITYFHESETTQKRAPGNLVLIQAEFNVPLKDFNIFGVENILGNRVAEVVTIKANLFGNTK
jgi:polyisoprenoid-binding protein YceI